VFIDQLDAIAPQRVDPALSGTAQRVVNQLLAELDGMEDLGQVVVMAATNNLDRVDPSLLRPGRFGVHLYVGLPDEEERAEILAIHLKPDALAANIDRDDLIARLAASTHGFSGADLAYLCQTAKLRALRESRFAAGGVAPRHFDEVLDDFSTLRALGAAE
jgi:transitional endoplasmic reticulum ATPase